MTEETILDLAAVACLAAIIAVCLTTMGGCAGCRPLVSLAYEHIAK